MNKALLVNDVAGEQDQRIADLVKLDGAKLKSFIRRRVAD